MIVESSTCNISGNDKCKGVPLLFAREIEAKGRYKVPEIRKKEGANTFAKGQGKGVYNLRAFYNYLVPRISYQSYCT